MSLVQKNVYNTQVMLNLDMAKLRPHLAGIFAPLSSRKILHILVKVLKYLKVTITKISQKLLCKINL